MFLEIGAKAPCSHRFFPPDCFSLSCARLPYDRPALRSRHRRAAGGTLRHLSQAGHVVTVVSCSGDLRGSSTKSTPPCEEGWETGLHRRQCEFSQGSGSWAGRLQKPCEGMRGSSARRHCMPHVPGHHTMPENYGKRFTYISLATWTVHLWQSRCRANGLSAKAAQVPAVRGASATTQESAFKMFMPVCHTMQATCIARSVEVLHCSGEGLQRSSRMHWGDEQAKHHQVNNSS